MVPFFNDVIGKPFVVVDYDLLMRDSRAQLERIGRRLGIPSRPARSRSTPSSQAFWMPACGTASSSPGDFDDGSAVARLTPEMPTSASTTSPPDRAGGGPGASLQADWSEFQARLSLILEPPPRRRPWPFRLLRP